MAKAGDELVSPVKGLRTVFQKTAQVTRARCYRWIGSPSWPLLGQPGVLAGDPGGSAGETKDAPNWKEYPKWKNRRQRRPDHSLCRRWRACRSAGRMRSKIVRS